MLRLPPGPDPAAAYRSEALGTAAGARLAAWLRSGGLPTPRWHVNVWSRPPLKPRDQYRFGGLPIVRIEVTTAPGGPRTTPRPNPHAAPPHHPQAVAPRTARTATDSPLVPALAAASAVLDARAIATAAANGGETFGLLGAPPPPIGPGSEGWHRLWPGILPWHRGLVAGFALPDAAATADMDQRGGAAVLPLLAETAGDGGPALPIAVAYALAARHEADRLAAVDALLLLAADGSFDAETAGHHLGLLAAAGAVTVNRTVRPLRDAAAAGARLSVFRLLAAALPALLAAEPPPRGTPDLLTLAAETAVAAPDRVEIAGLADLAARKGSSRLVVEARRLALAVS